MSSSLEAKLVVLGAQGKGELKTMLDTGSVKGKKEGEGKEKKRNHALTASLKPHRRWKDLLGEPLRQECL